MNLYDETVEALIDAGSSIENITYVWGDDFQIPVSNFIELAKSTNYDSGYGAAEIATDLKVGFTIGGFETYMYRYEYDGSEGWEYPKNTEPPEKIVTIKSLGGNNIMWDTLSEINKV